VRRRVLPQRAAHPPAEATIAARGLTMLQAQAVPPNDGGIALGQAWAALQAAAKL
jgi:Hydrogenase maturation factor